MSGRISKQRRRRWCDSALQPPTGYRKLVSSVIQASRADQQPCGRSSNQQASAQAQHAAQDAAELLLLSQLEAFSSSAYEHGDMEPLRALTAAVEQLAAVCPATTPAWTRSMQLLLELLFMHSSRPLHKQLLSFVKKVTPAHQTVVGQVLLALVKREATAVLLSTHTQQEQQQQWQLADCSANAGEQQSALDNVTADEAAAILKSPAHLPAAAANRGFDLAQAAISLLQMPSARGWLQPGAALLLLAVARSIHTTLQPAPVGQQQQQGHEQQGQAQEQAQQEQQQQQQQQQQQHLTPKTSELVQDAINVMYMVLQYHGQTMADQAATAAAGEAAAAGSVARAAICEAAGSMLCALQGSLVVREALASAAVVVWSAAVLPDVDPTAAALVFAAGLTAEQLPQGVAAAAAAAGGGTSSPIGVRAQQLLQSFRSSSLLEQQLAAQGSSLVQELQSTRLVARVCALRGLLNAMPPTALAGNLGLTWPHAGTSQPQQQQQPGQQEHGCADDSTVQASGCDSGSATGSSDSGGSFIMQCALPFALEAASTAPDAHFKFYAMSLLASVMQAAAQLWASLREQQRPQQDTSLEEAAAAAAAAAAPSAAADAAGGDAGTTSQHAGCSTRGSERQAAACERLVVPWLSTADAQAVTGLLLANLDEPVAQVLAKVQEAFESLLLLVKCQRRYADELGLEAPSSMNSTTNSTISLHSSSASHVMGQQTAAAGCNPWQDTSGFLQAAARSVLAIGVMRKGRYAPLGTLLPHVGASTLLQLQPGLVAETLEAMQSNLAASAAAGFFKTLLLQLHSEAPSDDDVAAAAGSAGVRPDAADQYNAGRPGLSAAEGAGASTGVLLQQHVPAAMRLWCRCWLPELLEALWGQGERARTYTTNYALPMVLQAEPQLLQPMVDIILAVQAADTYGRAPAGTQSAAAASSSSSTGGNVGAGVSGVRNAAAALVVVLRTARRLQLVGDLDILLPQQPQEASAAGSAAGDAGQCLSPADLLLSAVSSASAALRTEALELVCYSAKKTQPPGILELLVAQRWLALCLRCTGAESRHKSLALWEKLLARQAAAVKAIRHRAAVAHTPGATGGAHPKGLPRASRCFLTAPSQRSNAPGRPAAVPETDAEAEQRQLVFLDWMTHTLLDSLYPGAPYERKYFALELMALLLQQWLHEEPNSTAGSSKAGRRGGSTSDAAADAAAAAQGSVPGDSLASEPFLACLLSPECIETLLGCVVDSWDKMRVAASRVLELMPSPLPGCTTPQQVLPLLQWAMQLLQSPRVRESDAGARTLQLLVLKYLSGLGWVLCVAPEPAVSPPAAAACQQEPSAPRLVRSRGWGAGSGCASEQQLVQAAAAMLASLSGLLRDQLARAEADMTGLSRSGLVHGTLLALRYVIEVLPWLALAASSCNVSLGTSAAAAAACGLADSSSCSTGEPPCSSSSNSNTGSGELVVQVTGPASAVLHCWVTDLVGLLTTVADLVKPLLCAQDVNMAANGVDEADDDADSDTDAEDIAAAATAAAGSGGDVGDVQNSAVPAAAVVAAATAGRLPRPTVQLLISSCWMTWKEASLLIGTLASRLPLPRSTDNSSSTKGNGDAAAAAAADPVECAFNAAGDVAASCQQQQLLSCEELEQLGGLQLSMLLSMKHNGAVEKSQAGFIALVERLLESPEPCLNQLPRFWLGRCLSRVEEDGQCRDDIVRRSAGLPFATSSLFLAEPVGVPRHLLPYGLQQLLRMASNEDCPEPWPRVHGFNILRMVFNDSNMALDSSGWHAAGVVAAIEGMTAPAWEVRNAAALAFTALVMRVVGARNIDARQQKLLKPLNQLAATPAGLYTYSCMSGSSSTSSSSPGPAPQQGPTAVDFFTRYPQLHVFLLQQLNNAVRQQQRETAVGSSSTATVPPSLFPSLILLSRLRPLLLTNTAHPTGGIAAVGGVGGETSLAGPTEGSAAAAGSAAGPAGLDPSVFVPAVMTVGQSAVLGVRSMAAAALAPLVPAEQLHAVCLHLAACLPSAAAHARLLQHIAEPANDKDQLVSTAAAAGGGGGAEAVAGSGCGASVTQPASEAPLGQNALHGALLQLTALLAAVSSSTAMEHTGNSSSSSCSAAAVLVQQLMPAFASSTGLMAAGSSTSYAVRQAYVAAAGQLLVLAYRHWPLLLQQARTEAAADSRGCADLQLLKQFVGSLQARCLAAVQSTVTTGAAAAAGVTGSVSSSDAQDPLYSCWLRDTSALLMGPVLEMQVLLHSHDQADTQQHQPSSAASTSEQLHDMQVLTFQLQLLAEQLPLVLQGSLYEVRGAALKACAVQLERMLLVSRALQATGQLALVNGSSSSSSGSSNGSGSSSACLEVLSGCVWQALQEQQVVKVGKRLLAVWGLLQCLQQLLLPQGLLPVKQCKAALAPAGNPQGRLPPAATAQQASTGMAEFSGVDTEQLSVLLQMAEGCREPDASVNALLCAARVVHGMVYAHAPAAAAAAGPSCVQGHAFAALQGLCGVIDTFSKPHQPEQLRAAAAEALVLSGLLLPLAQGGGHQGTAPPGRSTPPAAPLAAKQGTAGPCTAHAGAHTPTGLKDVAAGGVQGLPAGNTSIPALLRLSLQAWYLAVRLMEDDDDDVRLAAAAAAQQALDLAPPGATVPLVDVLSGSSSNTASPAAATTASTSCPNTASDSAAPVTNGARGEEICAASATAGQQYVAAVQYRCFALLARCSGWYVDLLPDVVELLAEIIFPLDTAQPLVLQQQHQQRQLPALQQQQQSGSGQLAGPAAADQTASDPRQAGGCIRLPGVLLRRLFEREADNHHEEPLLLAQHAAAALHHILTHLQQQDLLRQRPSDSERAAAAAVGNAASGVARYDVEPAVLDKVLGTWCSSIAQRFLPAVVQRVAAVGRGAGNATACTAGDMIHPEVFVPLYRCCLALWAARPWLQQGEPTSEPLLPCGGGVQGELWAEVCALLTQLMQAHPPHAVAAMVQAVFSHAEESAGSRCAALFLLH